MSKKTRLFRQVVLFTFPNDWTCPSVEQMEAHMDRMRFTPTGPTQEQSIGWVSPRGKEYDALCEAIDGQLIMRIAIETRKVPSSAIKALVEKRAKAIEQHEGRRPGKKERKELAEAAKLELLPSAFPSKKTIMVWLDRVNSRIVLDSSSAGTCDEITAVLVQMFSDMDSALQLRGVMTKLSPTAAMAHWLVSQESPAGFTVDRDATLKSADESRAAVRYSRHPLDIEEIVKHVQHGKIPTQLAMTYDDRMSFVLCDNLTIKNIEALDTVFEGQEGDSDFDADISLVTRELGNMFNAVIETLDGLLVLGNDEGSAAGAVAAAEAASRSAVPA